jgi:16S rRNA (cytosine1402-N4)-methyltransferase
VIAIDRDPDAITAGQDMRHEYDGRLTLLEGRFSQMGTLLNEIDMPFVDGVVFDFGVSSPQIDDAERGFSFRFDGPLDMRMEKSGTDASDFINTATEKDIADVLWQFGEERASRRIARAIIRARDEAEITTTYQLAKVIRAVMPRPKPGQIDPATRSFQAIRIHINNELDEILTALPAAMACLKPGGRLAVVAFHSLEDRLVKTFIMNEAGKAPRPSRHVPDVPEHAPRLNMITRKPVTPSEDEMNLNPRSRSSRLRVAERTDAPLLDEVA